MSNKILFLFISIMLVLTLGLAAGLFMMWNKLSDLDTQANLSAKKQNEQSLSELSIGPIFSLDTFIVNLADAGGNRYLRVTMDLELDNEKLQEELSKRLPQIKDQILMILPTRRFEDISTTQGKIDLRTELIEQINRILSRGQVSNIYFKEFVVQ